ncbi:protein of unknown function [Xenorhabdus doucetiae]|uniref:Uncharacterized protein n=1 Tax=Xenorhabdus doucetiae TaxID=351671 RepID=A0A068QMC6_9GAMM|nr:protein of unknown function [Xenorhabdus doucetiae]
MRQHSDGAFLTKLFGLSGYYFQRIIIHYFGLLAMCGFWFA